MEFSKKNPVFTYWENPKGKEMPGFIQLCFKTFEKNIKSPFSLQIITPINVCKYIPDLPDEIWNIKPKNEGRSFNEKVRSIALRSGIIRWGLLKHYGGIWVDADSFIMSNFACVNKDTVSYDFGAKWCSVNNWPINSFMFSKKNGIIVSNCWERSKTILRYNQKLGWGQAGFRLGRDVVNTFGMAKVLRIQDDRVVLLTNEDRSLRLIDLNKIPTTAWLVSLNASSFGSNIRSKTAHEILDKNTYWNQLYMRSIDKQSY